MVGNRRAAAPMRNPRRRFRLRCERASVDTVVTIGTISAPSPSCQVLTVPRKLLATLVFAAPVLPAVITIVFVGSFVAQAAGDPGGAYALRWVGWAALMLLVLDLFALSVVLGLRALESDRRRRPEEDRQRGTGDRRP